MAVLIIKAFQLLITICTISNCCILLVSTASHYEKQSTISIHGNDLHHSSVKQASVHSIPSTSSNHHIGIPKLHSSEHIASIAHGEPHNRPKLSSHSTITHPAIQVTHSSNSVSNNSAASHIGGLVHHRATTGPNVVVTGHITGAPKLSKKYHKHFATRKVNVTEKLLKFNMYLDPICQQIDTLTQKQLNRVGLQLKQFSLHVSIIDH